MENDEKKGAAASARSAAEYLAAVEAVFDIAEMAMKFAPPAHPAVKAARAFISKARPLARKGAVAIPTIGPMVAPIAKKTASTVASAAPDAVNAGAKRVGGAVKGAGAAVGNAAGVAKDKVHAASEKRAQEKARRVARRALLDGAGVKMSAARFLENWDNQALLATGAADYLDYCGCYVIATYAGAVKKDDYSKFRDIFVGKSEHMGSSIHEQLVGRGNADVYADVKYGKHVHILLFPGTADKLDELESSLITALDADSSYNG